MKISRRQSRGLCTLLLVLLAEMLALSEAIQRPSVTPKPRRNECPASESTCDAATPPIVSRIWKLPRGGHSHTHAHATSIADTVAPYGLPLHYWKIILQAMLTAMNVLCWYLPLQSDKITSNTRLLSFANAFSGGVFLSLALGHLIPEAVHGEESLTPYWCVLGGYLLIFFVEKVAFDAHEILHEMQGDGHSHSHEHSKSATTATTTNNNRSALILLGALGVHSVLEMMALGLADTFADSALLSLSIALHQPAESIALLVALVKSGMPRNQIVQYLSIFSSMGPLGVGLGMAVNEYASPLVDRLVLALVAGTFVYVGATEVIPEEWETPHDKWPKFGALMAGIACIFGITQYTSQFHSH